MILETANISNTDTLGTFYTKPWINVKQSNVSINQYGEYDFGSVLAGETKDITFTIENLGGDNLNLISVNSNRVNLEENTDGYFSVIQQPLAPSVSPGNSITFTIRFYPQTIENNFSASVHIKTNSRNAEDFVFRVKGDGRDYVVGDTGPGGGIVFFSSGGQYKEVSSELGNMLWIDAVSATKDFRGGNFTDWQLPSIADWSLININLSTNTGRPTSGYYWSSDETSETVAQIFVFSNGTITTSNKLNNNRVRAVRSFTFE